MKLFWEWGYAGVPGDVLALVAEVEALRIERDEANRMAKWSGQIAEAARADLAVAREALEKIVRPQAYKLWGVTERVECAKEALSRLGTGDADVE